MMHYFYYNKNDLDKKVGMFSETRLDVSDVLIEVAIPITEEDIIKLNNGIVYEARIKDDGLVFITRPHELEAIDLKEKIKNANKLSDLKDILLKIV